LYLGAAMRVVVSMLYCRESSNVMARTTGESETVEVPRSLLEHLLSKVESLEARLLVSQEERERRQG
jgi:hypothetical protein